MAWSDGAPWRVSLLPSAQRELDDFDDAVREAAMEAITELEEDPFPAGCLEMRGHASWLRVRFYRERFRILYSVSEKQRLVLIRRVRPRSIA